MASAHKSNVFGDIAVEAGFVTPDQVDAALERMRAYSDAGRQELIGEVMLEMGFITSDQVEEVLRLQKERRQQNVRQLGNYEIIEKIGAGGMGAVYRARDIRGGKNVALKILPPRLAVDARYLMRFFREAEMATQLDHENIVKGLGTGEAGGIHFFAMEFIEGENVHDMMARVGAFPEATALNTILPVARALDHAHKHGLVHQDIKPENIIIDRKGVVKLLDLGLARRSSDLTKSRLGTPLYISPEQVTGRSTVDIRSDLYSLGVTLYHMVTGAPPFVGYDERDTMKKHVEEEMAWPQDIEPDLSDGICTVIARMMSKDPDQRYRSPAELIADLEAVVDGREPDTSAHRPVRHREGRPRIRDRHHPGAAAPGGASNLPVFYAASALVAALLAVAFYLVVSA